MIFALDGFYHTLLLNRGNGNVDRLQVHDVTRHLETSQLPRVVV